ncbi:MAG: bifunctional phosphoribosyl-AMP cyclohydrolase/phosphoribosyl-ATP diphosphatase HisIE [Armatimonadetes bacterium]|nr:bifunctional phosphoribosyl-AMP cyclohydrolase/phosphoribosyl-ATP diphosphatase HisIE [Armatimonadota bacterium]
MVDLQFGADGLIPVVVQDGASRQVLMVAYMNREALVRTVASGDAWYWSRAREVLWRKGEQSGHGQTVRAIQVDCDGDALLLTVGQEGAACHTGRRSCFFRDLEGRDIEAARGGPWPDDIFTDLFDVLKRRRGEMPAGSYTVSLLRAGRAPIGRKVQEEAEELTRAARTETDRRVVEEAADLIYHAWVLLVERGVELGAVQAELRRRRDGN